MLKVRQLKAHIARLEELYRKERLEVLFRRERGANKQDWDMLSRVYDDETEQRLEKARDND